MSDKFICGECGKRWQESAIAHGKPSGDACPECGTWKEQPAEQRGEAINGEGANEKC